MFFKAEKVGILNISKRIIVGTVKVAGINLAVPFDNVLVGTMTVHTALFRSLSVGKANKVVKKAD